MGILSSNRYLVLDIPIEFSSLSVMVVEAASLHVFYINDHTWCVHLGTINFFFLILADLFCLIITVALSCPGGKMIWLSTY